MRMIFTAAAALACAACGPSQYQLALQKCNEFTGTKALNCIYAADAEEAKRDAQLAAFNGIVGGATKAYAPPPAPMPAPAPQTTATVTCTDKVGPQGTTTCKVR